MANTYTTTLDSKTYALVQELKKKKGLTGGALIRLGCQVVMEGNPLKNKYNELEQDNKKLVGKINQLALKVYAMQDKQDGEQK